jgi:hypothetical protein
VDTYDELDREFAIVELEPRRTASPDEQTIIIVSGRHHGSGGSGGSGGHFHHGSGGSGGGSGT